MLEAQDNLKIIRKMYVMNWWNYQLKEKNCTVDIVIHLFVYTHSVKSHS